MNGSRPFRLEPGALRRVVVTSSRYKPEAHGLARELADRLETRGVAVVFDPQGGLDLAADAADADLVIAVGGDGTLLSTARRLVGAHVPVLGVNLGKLGFLAGHSADELRVYLDGAGPDGWRLSPKMMLQVRVNDDLAGTRYALNDVIVSQGVMTRLIDIDMDVDGLHAIQYRADGLVVSSPVGSTAYSLSLGGPILGQGLRAFVITPIAPHSLTNRPVVIDGASEVTFQVQSQPEELALLVDSQERIDLRMGDRVSVSAAPTDLLLVTPGQRSYFDVLRHKLGWGARPASLDTARRHHAPSDPHEVGDPDG